MLRRTVGVADPNKILLVLQEMCADRLPVALMSRDLLVVYHGIFALLGEEALLLEFDERPSGVGFSPPAFCIGSFNHDARPHLFTTRVKRNRLEADGGKATLEVEVPAALRWPESRKAVRLPVPTGAPLFTALRSSGRELDARALDLSLCGALIELTGADPPVLEAGDRVQFLAEFDGQGVQLPAIVRRRDPPLYGVYFPDSVVEGRLGPPLAWRKLVEALARYE